MAPKTSFKVIIAGGSIAGLTLANMLQLAEIDFLVLEAYPDIAPQVGASIGILPHGNRILDQLGVYKKILELSPPIDTLNFRNDSGELLAGHNGIYHSFVQRHGYPIVFLDRQMVIQILYDNIRNKSKVLTKTRVTKIEVDDDGVNVTAASGTVYRGNIIVGADGIHSTVRQQMWTIANKLAPGHIPITEPNAIAADYGCIFGISQPCKGLSAGQLHNVFRKNSYLVIGGPQGRVYYFAFFKFPKRHYGHDFPRFTAEDESRLAAERSGDHILPNLTFGDIYKKTIKSTTTTLPEYVYKRWHFHRIMTIGDAAHKVHPIAGQGGNAAIETAAVLVNFLRKALDDADSSCPNTEQLDHVFRQVQDVRRDRVSSLMETSHEQQRVEGLETFLRKITAIHLLPMADVEEVLFNFSRTIPMANKLELPKTALQSRPKLIPFKDELACEPTPRRIYGWLQAAFFILCSFSTFYGMWVWSAHYGLDNQLNTITTSGIFSYDTTFVLKRNYTGIKPIDDYLVFLAAIFVPGLKNWNRTFGMLQLYFLGMLIQPIAIYAIEACRPRNFLTPLSMPSIWLTLVQSAGIGIFMPLYYAVYIFSSRAQSYWWPLSRRIPDHYARSILPAILIGYVLPTGLMFVPWNDPFLVQLFEAIWQPSPMFVTPLIMVFGTIYKAYIPTNNKTITPHADTHPSDLKYLKRVYVVTGVMGGLFHVYALATIIFSADSSLTLRSVFIGDLSPEPKELGNGLHSLFLVDFWGFFIATYVWCCIAVWDLKRVGHTTIDVGKASIALLFSNMILGPGASMSACWYWRECAMARTSVKAPRSLYALLGRNMATKTIGVL